MPNFSSLARLEVPEKFLWWWWVVGFAKSFSCQTQPLCCVEVRVRVGVLTTSNDEILMEMSMVCGNIVNNKDLEYLPVEFSPSTCLTIAGNFYV